MDAPGPAYFYASCAIVIFKQSNSKLKAAVPSTLFFGLRDFAPPAFVFGTIERGGIMVEGGAVEEGIEKLAAAIRAVEWDQHLADWLAAGSYPKARRVAEGREIVEQAIAEVAAGGARIFELDLH
jgi:hypothetical protein